MNDQHQAPAALVPPVGPHNRSGRAAETEIHVLLLGSEARFFQPVAIRCAHCAVPVWEASHGTGT